MSHQPAELQTTLARVASLATEQQPAVAAVSVVIWDSAQESFSVSASTVPEQPAGTAARDVRSVGGASRWIVDNRKPCVVADIAADPFCANPLLKRYSYRAYVGHPMVADDETLGVLYTLYRRPHRPTPEESEEQGKLAEWAAVAVAEAWKAEGTRREMRTLRLGHGELRKRVKDLRMQLHEAAALDGLIRICMSCKNVRNQDGEWERIEKYLAHRSRVEFSHGLCSDCLRELSLDPPIDPGP